MACIGDPFKDDPFFSGKGGGGFGGFGQMDKMIQEMRSDMRRQMDNPASLMGNVKGSGGGHFK